MVERMSSITWEHNIDNWLYRDSRPFLKLHENEIWEYVARFHRIHGEPTAEDYEQAKNMLWIYHQDRFFDTLKGYHQVILTVLSAECRSH